MYVFNKSRWDTVANEGLLHLFITTTYITTTAATIATAMEDKPNRFKISINSKNIRFPCRTVYKGIWHLDLVFTHEGYEVSFNIWYCLWRWQYLFGTLHQSMQSILARTREYIHFTEMMTSHLCFIITRISVNFTQPVWEEYAASAVKLQAACSSYSTTSRSHYIDSHPSSLIWVAQTLEVLRCKPEGRGLESRWDHWTVSVYLVLPEGLWPWGLFSL
jgi:hypothetical protein